jgi:acyl carrier protein
MADSGQLLKHIIDAIASHTEMDASTFTADTRLDTLDVSSFDFLEIVFKIEEKFGVQLDLNTMEGINTIGELTEIAKQQIEAAAQPKSA